MRSLSPNPGAVNTFFSKILVKVLTNSFPLFFTCTLLIFLSSYSTRLQIRILWTWQDVPGTRRQRSQEYRLLSVKLSCNSLRLHSLLLPLHLFEAPDSRYAPHLHMKIRTYYSSRRIPIAPEENAKAAGTDRVITLLLALHHLLLYH